MMGMGFKVIVVLLLVLVVRTFSGLTSGGAGVDSIYGHKLLGVERKLNHLKKNALKSIHSEDGDIIDCVDIYKQPAFDHPALRNHTIQMTPSYHPTMETTSTTMKASTKGNVGSSLTVTSQLWQRSGSCPEGTIPIRRIQKQDLLKANSLKDFRRKKPRFSQRFQQLDDNIDLFLPQENHSVAILIAQGFSYLGAQGDIKVDNPFVESDDYSTSQVSLKNGNDMYYEAVESGWAVNPRVYGDRTTRLFVYWTVDSSNTTGCFDLTCPGFVQTSNKVALGAAIYPISTSKGLPYQITVFIHKDPNTNNWWVQYNGVNIGYWPPDLFGALRYHAVSVEWGGEVYSSKVGTHPHTATAMGNGQFPNWSDYGCISGCIKRMRVLENSLDLRFPEFVNSYANEYRCYDVFYIEDYVEDPEFYYGGPGKSLWCP